MKKFTRSAGVLLNVSSLPSPYGIGGFGREVDEMCDFLLRGGFHYWQILPLNTIGLGDSPYSGISAFAGNYLYVDPESWKPTEPFPARMPAPRSIRANLI